MSEDKGDITIAVLIISFIAIFPWLSCIKNRWKRKKGEKQSISWTDLFSS